MTGEEVATADAGAVSEIEGGIDGVGDAAAPAAAIGPGPGGEVVLVGSDKKKKKKRGSRGGKLLKLPRHQREAFLRARDEDGN